MLSPDEIASRQFLIALRGYDRDEVQAFLNQVADERRQLQERVAQLEAQLRDGGMEAAPPAETSAPDDDEEVEASPAEVERTTADASRFAGLSADEPKAVFAALGEETTRILVAAEESARSIRERAEERARAELESSRREARDEVAGARRTASKIISDAESRRNGVAEEIRRLEGTRDRYAEDLRGAVVTVQNAMRSLSTSASAGPREGETASAHSASRTDADADADDPARAGHDADLGTLPAADLTSDEDASSSVDDSDDADHVLDRIEADIRAAEEDATGTAVDGDALALAGLADGDDDVDVAVALDGAPDDADELLADPVVPGDAVTDATEVTLPDGEGEQHPDVDPLGDVVDDAEEHDDSGDAEVAAAVDEHAAVADVGADDADELVAALADDDVAAQQEDARALDLRNAALSAIRPGAMRILKRSLQDVQNGVLDALRRAGEEPQVNDLLPPPADLAQLGQVAQPHLATAHEAGVQDGLLLAGADSEKASDAAQHGVDTAVAGLQDALGSDITTHLRASLTQGVAAGERPTQLSERVGEVFRDLKGATAEAVVDGELARAYGWGLLAAWQVTDVDGKRWVRGDELRCPEDMCQTNAAAGTLPLDASFPTGEVVPPPHDGCDCTLGPAV